MTTDFFGGDDEIRGVVVLPDGRVVAVGAARNPSSASIDFALARYEGDDTVPPPPPDAAPVVQSVVINDGSIQRSMVTSFTVTFSEVVTLDPGAFELARADGSLVGVVATTSVIDGRMVAVLTFSGPDVIGGSLADGNYTLTIHAERVRDDAGQALEGDGDGTAGGDRIDTFFRLFGDADGDRDVDATDQALFKATKGLRAGDLGFIAFFDFDGDGDVDGKDSSQLSRRLGTVLAP